jgi:hypothetical protein
MMLSGSAKAHDTPAKDEREEISFEGEEISLVENSLSAEHFVHTFGETFCIERYTQPDKCRSRT